MKLLPSRHACRIAMLSATVSILGACVAPGGFGRSPLPSHPLVIGSAGLGAKPGQAGPMGISRIDMGALQAKNQFVQDLMSNPDLPAWHEQRQQLTLATGDRVFEKPFDEVFDGMLVALATLGSRVTNIERGSGYITGTLPDLGPERNQQLQQEALAEYARIKGYPDSVLQTQGSFGLNPTVSQNMMSRMGGSGLTLTMLRQSAHQTKVKLRFDNVYYPKTNLELYKHVWVAVDRQMFLDKGLDH